MTPKFKYGQKVVIEDFLINGSRQTTWAVVQRYRKNMVEVELNGVYIQLPESRLTDYDLYWQTKHNETK